MALKRGYSTDDSSAAMSPATEEGAHALLANFVEDNSTSNLIPLHNFLLASGSTISAQFASKVHSSSVGGGGGGQGGGPDVLDVQAISLERMEKAIAAALLQHSRLVQLAMEAAAALSTAGPDQFNMSKKFKPIQRCYNVITEIRQLLCEGEKTNVSLHVLTQYTTENARFLLRFAPVCSKSLDWKAGSSGKEKSGQFMRIGSLSGQIARTGSPAASQVGGSLQRTRSAFTEVIEDGPQRTANAGWSGAASSSADGGGAGLDADLSQHPDSGRTFEVDEVLLASDIAYFLKTKLPLSQLWSLMALRRRRAEMRCNALASLTLLVERLHFNSNGKFSGVLGQQCLRRVLEPTVTLLGGGEGAASSFHYANDTSGCGLNLESDMSAKARLFLLSLLPPIEAGLKSPKKPSTNVAVVALRAWACLFTIHDATKLLTKTTLDTFCSALSSAPSANPSDEDEDEDGCPLPPPSSFSLPPVPVSVDSPLILSSSTLRELALQVHLSSSSLPLLCLPLS